MGIDLFKLDVWYLVVVDYYSRIFETAQLKTLTEKEVILKCKEIFDRYGISEVVRSDCGTQMASEFRHFAKEYDFEHITSSPKYPQSNGATEAAVKIAKNIFKSAKTIYT